MELVYSINITHIFKGAKFMTEQNRKENIICGVHNTSESVKSVPSCLPMQFNDAINWARQNCGFRDAVLEDPANEKFYGQLCLIIAEIMSKAPASQIKLNGEMINVGQAQAVFSNITSWELRYVADRFCNIDYPVNRVKAYLTTALYNAVFESEAGNNNDFNSGRMG